MTDIEQTYTLTTEQIRTEWIESGSPSPTRRLHAGAAFDRWLAAHDEAVRREECEKAEVALGEELDRVEQLHSVADRLAHAIASIEVIGEHSSGNDPWENAIEYAEWREAVIRREEREKAAQIVRAFGTEHGWPRDHRMVMAAERILAQGKEQ